MSFRDWMAAALYDEHDGYYCREARVRWGRGGDYRTSPEQSILFAATFAAYFAECYRALGSPAQFTILEVGGGGGEFARDVLTTLKRQYPSVYAATLYLCDEINGDVMRARLEPFKERVAFRRLCDMTEPIATGIIFSNELLDAFPVHKVCWREGKLCEMFVALDDEENFMWVEGELSDARLEGYFAEYDVTLIDGQSAEVNLAASDWIKGVAASLVRGRIITVDYGAKADALYHVPTRYDGTLRSFAHHRLTDDVLAHPGEQDITATINWTQIIKKGNDAGLRTHDFQRQDRFLLEARLLAQLARLSDEAASEVQVTALRLNAREMILPTAMGANFQVLVQEKS